jgi:adenylate kinase family enzyme
VNEAAPQWPALDWRRVVVIGSSGSGKTSLARALAHRLAGVHIELDALYWGPRWEPQAPAEFKGAVAHAAAGERWVSDGNYSGVRSVLWPRATLVVWLNLPFHVVLWRVLRRTLRRVFRGESLWHGNRESLGRSFLSRESILWWVITTYRRRRREFAALRDAGAFPHLAWLELRRAREVRELLQLLEDARDDPPVESVRA